MAGRSAQANASIPWTVRGVEICLGLAVAVPPFVFGARQAYGQLALAVFVLAGFVLWIGGKIAREPIGNSLRRPEVLLPLAAVVLSIVTWISLPPSLIRELAPGIGKLLPDWAGRSLGAHQDWNTFSLTPGLSRDGTCLFVLYALLFWMTVDTVRHLDSVQRLLRILFVAGVGVAALGLLHYLFWNGKFYWLWEIWWVEPDRQVRAPFTNRNHFAGFLALTVGPGVAVLMRLIKDWNRTNYSPSGMSPRPGGFQEIKVLVAAGGLILIAAGIVLSQSRGGMVVGLMVAAICIIGIISAPSAQPYSRGKSGLLDRSPFPPRRSYLAPATDGLGATGPLAIGLIILASLGLAITFARQDPFQRAVQALGDNQSLDELLNDRLRVWKADLQAVKDFPFLGSGPGSHQYVCPVYLNNPGPFTFTHAENCYVQVLMECGLAGGVLLLIALLFLGRWSWRALQHFGRSRSTAMASLAVAVSLLAGLVHATVDFVWYVPAYAATLAVLAGLIRSLAHKSEWADGRGGEGEIGAEMSSNFEIRSLKSEAPYPSGGEGRLKLAGFGFRISDFGFRAALAATSIALALVVGTRFLQAAQTEYAWNAYYRLARESGANPATLDARVRWLTLACDCGSADPDHYLQLGLAKLEWFLQRRKQAASPAGLLQARKLLQQGRFAGDGEARAWLQNRYGDDLVLLQEAQAALNKSLDRCPLLGEAYLYLAKLCFLDNATGPAPAPYWRQAQLVRPYNPDVHLQVGLEDWHAGDLDGARAAWRRACGLLPSCQSRLLPFLAERLPAQEVVDFIPLDFEGLKWLTLTEKQKGQTESSRLVAGKAQQTVQDHPDMARNPAFWIALDELWQQIGQPMQAEACLRKALQVAPDRLGIHLLLVRCLMEGGKWREALGYAQNARQQFSNNPDVQALVNDILAMKAPWVAQGKEKANQPMATSNR